MAKSSGGVRTLKRGSQEYNKRQKEVADMIASGKYQSVQMSNGGGYVAIEKSTSKHKPEEIECANILANKGYKVVLINESGNGFKVKSTDGYLFTASFEQRTPTKDVGKTIRNALFHAKSKNADIALVYSKNHVFTRKSVDDGINLFEEVSDYKFKQIIVVADNGNIHKHKHNK